MKNDLVDANDIKTACAKKEMKYNPHAGHRERLRKKFEENPEMNVFEDHEALEFHLSLVIPRKDTNELAHELLRTFGSLDAVLCATPLELFKVKNMTTAAAYLLASEFSMVRKAMKASLVRIKSPDMNTPEGGIMYMFPQFIGRKNECFCLTLLDSNCKVIKSFFAEGAESGGITVSVSDILAKATRDGATFVMIAHNHPSNNVAPSIEDLQMTKRLFDALSSVGKFMLDHVIFSNNDIFSFHNNGILDKYEDDFYHGLQHESMCDNSKYKRKFLLSLNEYLLAPSKGNETILNVKSKTEIFDEYVKQCRQTVFADIL